MSDRFQPVEIVGGGLAGLGLGLALLRRRVPVTLFEAGSYPRQRVCGEFIAGLEPTTIDRLGLGPVLRDAEPHRDVAWFHRDRLIRRQRLPETAWAISRLDLDGRLAALFEKAGGKLFTRSRITVEPSPGRVIATGRRRAETPWIGLKLHVRGLELDRGLELHLGHHSYIGLCRLPNGEINLCGLFQRRELAGGSRLQLLVAYLRAAGLMRLADRVERADFCPGSDAAVAGLGFDSYRDTGEVALGDAQGMLPPFMGNGMAAAFQSAEEALDPLARWSSGHATWEDTAATIRQRLHRRFSKRSRFGTALHAFILNPTRQTLLSFLAQARCLPAGLLYRCLH